jgi:hypothetical protein
MKRALIAVTAFLLSAPVFAQTVANGPYYATPSWDQTLPVAQRFIVLANFNQQAVLDRETGLVWERSPSTTRISRETSRFDCINRVIGGHKGWRVPSVHELMSLVDPSVAPPGPTLPAGHPFINIGGDLYWTATAFPFVAGSVPWEVSFNTGNAGVNNAALRFVWCVRGGGPIDQY